MPPPMQGYKTEDYNENGDRTMARVYIQAKFDNLNDTLSAAKAKTDYLKSAPKISSKNSQGPVPNASQQWKKNVYTSQPNSKKYAQYAKNINDTENEINRFDDNIWDKAEAERQQQQNTMLQNSVKQPQQSQQGPIDVKNNTKNDKNEE